MGMLVPLNEFMGVPMDSFILAMDMGVAVDMFMLVGMDQIAVTMGMSMHMAVRMGML